MTTYQDSFDTFCLFLSLKNHFTQESYDFVRYRGKTNATKEAFEKRKDRLQFQKLSRKAPEDEIVGFIIANLVAGKTWVGQFLEQEADAIYENFKKAVTDLIGTVASETKQALETHPRPFAIDKHEYPGILLCQLDGTVSYPTMVVLNNFIDFVPRYDDAYAGDEVWAATALMIRKLRPFVSYDKKAMKDRLKEILL